MKKDIESKDNNKKKKKGIVGKIIKFIIILILLAIIGYGCNFAYQYFNHTKQMGEEKVYDPLSAAALGIDPEKLKTIGRLNVLLLGESGVGDGYKLTDTIMIASYNPQTQQASILSIPTPALIINFKFPSLATSKTSLVTLVADLITKASYSLSTSPNSSLL